MIRSPIVAAVTKTAIRLLAKPASAKSSSFSDGVIARSIHSVVTIRQQTMSTTTSATTTTTVSSSSLQTLLRDLRQLDTSSLCDAEKTIGSDEGRNGIKLMNGTIRPMNHIHRQHPVDGANVNVNVVMAGVARTVAFTEPNDFLPVMRALALEAEMDEVLVVDTSPRRVP